MKKENKHDNEKKNVILEKMISVIINLEKIVWNLLEQGNIINND
jgi:hypothetical protein